MRRATIFLMVAFAAQLFGQSEDFKVKSIVIDHTKPYVYLKFDHIGPRVPIQDGESNVGLWLRVVNNCRIPIVFRTFSMPPGNPGVGLDDEIVEESPMTRFVLSEAEVEEYDRQEQLRKLNLRHKPTGYSSETGGIRSLQPGDDLLFSVPRNHVGKDWYIRVWFTLDLTPSSLGDGPFTYLSFHQSDIPK